LFDLFKLLKKDPSSKELAKERLRVVLVNDRTKCSPEIIETVKGNLLDVLSKYVDIEEEGLDIKIENSVDETDGKPLLTAYIPIKNLKR
jgi:cell division topological specificity factor